MSDLFLVYILGVLVSLVVFYGFNLGGDRHQPARFPTVVGVVGSLMWPLAIVVTATLVVMLTIMLICDPAAP